MKKSILISALIAIAFSVNAQQFTLRQMTAERPIQKATTEDLMEYGYCGELGQFIGMGQAATLRALIEIPAQDAAKFEGAKIAKLNLGIGSYNGDITVIIMNSLDAAPVYTQICSVTEESWNEITLETPYTIGTEGFYVGYQVVCSAADYPIGVDTEAPNALSDYVGIRSGLTYQYMHLGEQGFGNNCIKLLLSGDNLPKYDLALKELKINEYVKTGTEFSINGTVRNTASKSISSYDVTYQINDQTPVTTTISNAVNTSSTGKFTIDGLTLEQDGTYNITVTVSNLDGNADENNADNTLSKTVSAISNFVPRKVLVENFSTALCGNCPRVHSWLKSITSSRDDIAWVVHHAGYYTDDYTISESERYQWFYNSNSTYAPALMIDRKDLSSQGSGANAPVFLPSSQQQIQDLIDYCLEQPAFVSVNIEDVYNEETRELAIRVWGKSEAEFNKTPYINIFLTENGLIGAQSGGGNQYEHSHALRKVMTDTWGDELTLNNNEYDVTYTCTIDNDWKPENMSVVAFISDFNSSNLFDCQVYNSEWKEFEYDAAVNDITADKHNVWSAGKSICINGQYKNADIYSTDGRLVATANCASLINVENAGIYIVVIDGASHKVAVK